MDGERWVDILRRTFAGRRVILKHEVIAATTETVRLLRSLDATDVLVIATSGQGLGELPNPDEARCISLDIAPPRDANMVQAIRAGNAAIANLPAWVRAEVDRFDPDRSALVIGDFLNESVDLAGRPFGAYRRPEWLALDDKTIIDTLWDRVGVPRADSAIVDATPATVAKVFRTLNRGDGVVLAIDAVDGWTGGGMGTRWAPTTADIETALDGWQGPGRTVRVMPFLEGIPCSIHGIVFPATTIALRPVEMVTLRRADHTFFYAGCSSFYDPTDADRAAMRSLARRVGDTLRSEVGFRDAFTIDGVMTADGFRPTELNPRNGAGLTTMLRGLNPPFPLQLLLDVLGTDASNINWHEEELEALLLDEFDAHRSGGTWRALPGVRDAQADIALVYDGARVRATEGAEPHDMTYAIGPSPTGSFLRARFVSDRTPVGPSSAPLAAAVWTYLDEQLALGIGPVTAARNVRV
jgi:hypothetical protein